MRRRRCRLPSGRLHLGMVADIKSERWPASRRNGWPASVGIRNWRPRRHLGSCPTEAGQGCPGSWRGLRDIPMVPGRQLHDPPPFRPHRSETHTERWGRPRVRSALFVMGPGVGSVRRAACSRSRPSCCSGFWRACRVASRRPA
jgi:hypothetical protein